MHGRCSAHAVRDVRAVRVSVGHSDDVARQHVVNGLSDSGRQSDESLHTVAAGGNDDETESHRLEVLLNSMLWSPVTRTSKEPEVRLSSSPFLTPDQPRRGTVRTSWLGKWAANCRGTDSSRRTRTVRHEIFGKPQNRHDLLAADGRKRVEKLVQAVTRGQVFEQDPNRHPRPDEHGSATKDLRIGMARRLSRQHTGRIPSGQRLR